MDSNGNYGQRQMFKGDWTCSQCGATISELPFQPEGDRPVFCRDCHRAKKQSRPQGRFSR